MNQKLAEARILAARKMPYMTHQVMTLNPVERPGLGTMAVDEYCRMYFDPAFLDGRDLKHLAFVVLHEAIHVWSRHAKRCVRLLGEEPANDRLEIWRLAVDAAVNDVLEQSGLRCPEEGITPAKLGLPRNKTAEEYFDLLMQRQEQGREERGEGRGKNDEARMTNDEGNPPSSNPQSLIPLPPAAVVRMASRGRGRMARRRRHQNIPAWRNTTKTSGTPPSPRRSNSIKSSGAVGACPADWPEPPPSWFTPRWTRPGNCGPR